MVMIAASMAASIEQLIINSQIEIYINYEAMDPP
jgi:hypothetical protein